MLTKNKRFEEGLVNGSRGVVLEINELHCPIVMFDNGVYTPRSAWQRMVFFGVFGVAVIVLIGLHQYVFSGIFVSSLVYFVHITNDLGEVLNGYSYLYQNIFVPIAGNMNGSLLFAITHIIFFWFLTYVLYKRKIFIKI